MILIPILVFGLALALVLYTAYKNKKLLIEDTDDVTALIKSSLLFEYSEAGGKKFSQKADLTIPFVSNRETYLISSDDIVHLCPKIPRTELVKTLEAHIGLAIKCEDLREWSLLFNKQGSNYTYSIDNTEEDEVAALLPGDVTSLNVSFYGDYHEFLKEDPNNGVLNMNLIFRDIHNNTFSVSGNYEIINPEKVNPFIITKLNKPIFL
jgi:hypothetical protein